MKRLATLILFISVATTANAQMPSHSSTAAEGEVVPGQFILKLSSSSTDPLRDAERLLARLAGRFGGLAIRSWLRPELVSRGGGVHKSTVSRRGLDRILHVEFTNGDDPRVVVAKIAGLSGIEYIEPVYRRHIHAAPNDPEIGRQWYLERIRAFDAWGTFTSDSTTIIAIVDTGVDWMHPDLAAAIWKNPGENGPDGRGGDRRTNRSDDDGNGFVDDWTGYDFAGRDGRSSDNDPRPGHWHGTHVSGIAAGVGNNSIGIAGVAHGARIMALKIADDGRAQPTLVNGYDALLYAVRMGATVINCSWGGAGRMHAEQDVIDAVGDAGALVVAAAGNEGSQSPSYPAAYRGVLSVASVKPADERSLFSNFNSTVGIAAPGDSIYSTLPTSQSLDGYGGADGTSMSAPMVAASAALVRGRYPSLDPGQVAAVLRASADNIDAQNPNFKSLLGSGRLNVARALANGPNAVMADVESVEVVDANRNGIVESGEAFVLQATVRNYLLPTSGLELRVENSSDRLVTVTSGVARLGAMGSGERRSIDTAALQLIADSSDGFDQIVSLRLSLVDGATVIASTRVDVTINPNYGTTATDEVAATFTGDGRIGYNDFPANEQGVGFRFRGAANVLAEGGLLIGTATSRLSDVVRSVEPGVQSQGLQTVRPYRVRVDDAEQLEIGVCEFDDAHLGESQRNGLHVMLTSYASTAPGRANQILLLYRITNTSNAPFDRLHAALFLDWDIGFGGANNQVRLDHENRLGYTYNVHTAGMPYVAAMLVGNQPMNFFAADNNSSPMAGGFYQSEKWESISSGIVREVSAVGDCSTIIGAGPITLAPGADTTIAFSLIAGHDPAALVAGASQAREMLGRFGLAVGEPLVLPIALDLLDGYPNPFESSTTIKFTVPVEGHIEVDVFSAVGEHVASLAHGTFTRGVHSLVFAPDGASQMYFVRLIYGGETILRKVVRLGTGG